jgi:hypothetical protein
MNTELRVPLKRHLEIFLIFTALQKVHLPFDKLTALSKAEGRRCASSCFSGRSFSEG